MFKIGDIVRPIKRFSAHRYLFKIHKILRNLDNNISGYKLQRIEQKIDPVYGPTDKQLCFISFAENEIWNENELELAGPTPDNPVEIKNKNLFDLKEKSFKGATIQGPIYQEPTTYVPFDVKYYKDVNLDSLKINELSKFLNNKEENEMSILDLYEKRMKEKIRKEHEETAKKIIAEDEIQKIIKEMNKQVNTILENEGREDRLFTDAPDLYLEATEDKLDNLEEEKEEQLKNLRSTLEEIGALFEMTDSYEERIKILKNYDILDKGGKLNV